MPKVEQIDRDAAARLLVGPKVGGGDGSTYISREPSHAETAQAFAAHRLAERERLATVTPEVLANIGISDEDCRYLAESKDVGQARARFNAAVKRGIRQALANHDAKGDE